MTLLADKDERFKHLFGKAVIFIGLAALGIGLVLFWMGIQKGLFTPQTPIRFVADSGQDLSVGMPVKYSGFKIGKLHTLTLDEEGHVQVNLSLETRYLKLLKQDAVVSLKKEGVIGDGVLEISQGSESLPSLKAGNKVRFVRASGLEQVVLEMKNSALPILEEVNAMLTNPKGDVRQTLTNLRDFSAELHALTIEMRGTRQRIDQVLSGVDSSLTNDVTPLLRSLRETAAHAESISGKIERDMPEVMTKATDTLANVRDASQVLNSAVQQAAPQLPVLLNETQDTLGKTRDMLDSTQEIVDGLSRTWPLNHVVPAAENGPIRMDSHD